MNVTNLIWFRNDLRVDDNPALYYSMQDKNRSVVAVYFLCQEQWRLHQVGSNHQSLVFEALKNLELSLQQLNVPLLVIEAGTFDQVPDMMFDLCKLLNVENCYFNLELLINERTRDKTTVEKLNGQVKCHRFNDQTLTPPWKIINGEGSGYKVFSAFARSVHQYLENQPILPLPVPDAKTIKNSQYFKAQSLIGFNVFKNLSKNLSSLILPEINEVKILTTLTDFCQKHIDKYQVMRDIPSIMGTSGLSAALAVGAISTSRCFYTARRIKGEKAANWINELIWRDFYRSVVWHFPKVVKGCAFNDVEKCIKWSDSKTQFEQWKQGKTGVPIIDAAINQLLQTGWMHNRLRMIVASYLTKNLWIDWRRGEGFFAQHLFDYDFASNNGGWQWCASVGTDAAPYFRVFNPASQQKKFDSEAVFIKRWLPELKHIDAKKIHQFEKLPIDSYYTPQVDLKLSRKQAIESFKNAKHQLIG